MISLTPSHRWSAMRPGSIDIKMSRHTNIKTKDIPKIKVFQRFSQASLGLGNGLAKISTKSSYPAQAVEEL
jgi:hypothetical protein